MKTNRVLSVAASVVAVIALLVAVAAYVGPSAGSPVSLTRANVTFGPSQPVRFRNVYVENALYSANDIEAADAMYAADITASDDVVVGDDLTVTGDVYANGGLDLNGQILVVDADADSKIQGVPDDVISVTLGAATGSLNVLTGNAKVGNGTPSVTLNGEDLYVEGTVEADGAVRFDSTLSTVGDVKIGAIGISKYTIAGATGNTTITGTLDAGNTSVGTLDASGVASLDGGIDVDSAFTVADTSGNVATSGALAVTGAATFADDVTITNAAGNAAVRNQFIGLPRVKLVAPGALKNGATEIGSYLDDDPGGEWTVITATVIATDTTYYRVGTASLKVTFGAAAVAYDGVQGEITNDDLESNESVGFWIYSTDALDAGDLQFRTLDTGPVITKFDVPAVAANTWTWVEINISALNAGTGDVVDDVQVVLFDETHDEFSIYLDGMYKWDADMEVALGAPVLYDGVLSVLSVKTDTAQANTMLALTEYTNYFVHYETGNDFIVCIDDQSTYSGIALVAY